MAIKVRTQTPFGIYEKTIFPHKYSYYENKASRLLAKQGITPENIPQQEYQSILKDTIYELHDEDYDRKMSEFYDNLYEWLAARIYKTLQGKGVNTESYKETIDGLIHNIVRNIYKHFDDKVVDGWFLRYENKVQEYDITREINSLIERITELVNNGWTL